MESDQFDIFINSVLWLLWFSLPVVAATLAIAYFNSKETIGGLLGLSILILIAVTVAEFFDKITYWGAIEGLIALVSLGLLSAGGGALVPPLPYIYKYSIPT